MALKQITVTRGLSKNKSNSPIAEPPRLLAPPTSNQTNTVPTDLQLLASIPIQYQLPHLIPDLIAMVKEGRIKSALERADPRDPNSIIFNDESQDPHRKDELLEKEIIGGTIRQPIGDLVCWNRQCGQKTIVQEDKQTRSLDEGDTGFYVCRSCGSRKRMA